MPKGKVNGSVKKGYGFIREEEKEGIFFYMFLHLKNLNLEF